MERQADQAQEQPSGPGDSLLRAIVRGTTDAVFAKDLDGRYAWVNPRHARFLGRTAQEIVGRRDHELFAPDFTAELGRSDAHVLANHEPMTYEIISLGTGEEQVFLTTKSAYYDDAGNVVGLIGVSRDITEERRHEAELRALAGRQQALAELSDAALAGASLSQLLGSATHVVRDQLGVEYSKVLELRPDRTMLLTAGVGWEEGVVGSAVEEAAEGSQAGYTLQQEAPVFVEDVRAETRFRFPRMIMNHGVISTMSTAILTPTGPFGVLEVDTVRRRRFSDSDLHFLQSVANLLGSAIGRARAEEWLAAERERLRVVVESTTVGVVVVDASTRKITMMNAAAGRIFGFQRATPYRLEEFLNTPERFRPDGTPYGPAETPIERALQGETISAEQVHLRAPSGQLTPVLKNAAPIYRGGRGGGDIIGAVEVVQDVSALEETERLKRDFYAMVAHEIRSPVASIKSAVELARMDVEAGSTEEALASLDAIDSLADRLVQLARDLLDIAQMEEGAFSVERGPNLLTPVLHEAVSIATGASGRRVEVSAPSDLPAVLMDGGRVLQVLVNLLNNAARFAEPGSTIAIDAERVGGEVVVRVRNRGEAIPPDKAPLLFQKFTQVHNGEGGRTGTGLGLAICKGIVDAHRGRIWTERHEEQGETVFAFTLPLAEPIA